MTTRVLTALDPGVEAQVATAVGGVREATIARRCVDLADLLASAEAGLGDVALVSAGLRGLGRDDVARLAASGARTIALVTGEEDEARVRQLGIAGVVRADASVADLEAALTAGGAEWAAELGLLDDAAGAGVPTPHGAPVVPQQPPAPEPAEGRITAVWGPTGAPGRTTIAVNLAAELAAAACSARGRGLVPRAGDSRILSVSDRRAPCAQSSRVEGRAAFRAFRMVGAVLRRCPRGAVEGASSMLAR